MGNTYILHRNNNNLINREVRIRSHKLVVDNFSCGDDPCVVPVGLTKILKFMSGM